MTANSKTVYEITIISFISFNWLLKKADSLLTQHFWSYLDSHWVDCSTNLKTALLKHHNGCVVNAGTWRLTEGRMQSRECQTMPLWDSWRIKPSILTFRKNEDGQLGFIFNMVTQSAKQYMFMSSLKRKKIYESHFNETHLKKNCNVKRGKLSCGEKLVILPFGH